MAGLVISKGYATLYELQTIYSYEDMLYTADNWRSVVKQRTDKESTEWWIGVKDDPEDHIPWRKRKDKR